MDSKAETRKIVITTLLALCCIVFFCGMLCFGQVNIPFSTVVEILFGDSTQNEAWKVIVLQSRLPMALSALTAGAALSVSGLMLQTTFRNSLAGPSMMGISSGASLGVACVILLASLIPSFSAQAREIGALGGALAGAAVVLVALSVFSTVLKNSMSLLIIGILISYLAGSVISLLDIFAPADALRSFVVWGLGSFSTVTDTQLPLYCTLSALACAAGLYCIKPLDAMLLGDRYLRTMGYSVSRVRTMVLTVAGIQTAIVTAYCGPIGFIGLVVPHVARMAYNTSSHRVLYPICLLCGAAVALFCALLSVMPRESGVIPINAVTPLIGVPVIIFVMLNSRRLNYLN